MNYRTPAEARAQNSKVRAAARPARVTFCSRDYVRSHCRDPRGRGSWAFRFDDDEDGEPFFAPHNRTFAEAKQAAAAEARQRGATCVRVQP